MGNVATNITTGKPRITGGVYVAPRTAALPTDAKTALSADYVTLGYISEDGVENSNEPDFNEIKEWGGSIVYRSLSGMDDTFALTLIESLNVNVLKAVYGDSNVSVDGNGKITVANVAEDPQEKIWVFELALRNGKLRRIVIPDGAITARESVTYNATDAIGYGITVTAYPDANNRTHIEYTEDEGTATSYTVTFDVDGGSAISAQIVSAGNTATRPTNPTKEGYTFAGWYTSDALTTEFDFYTGITANTTIYAKWTEI